MESLKPPLQVLAILLPDQTSDIPCRQKNLYHIYLARNIMDRETPLTFPLWAGRRGSLPWIHTRPGQVQFWRQGIRLRDAVLLILSNIRQLSCYIVFDSKWFALMSKGESNAYPRSTMMGKRTPTSLSPKPTPPPLFWSQQYQRRMTIFPHGLMEVFGSLGYT